MHILIVEDHFDFAQYVEQALSQFGFPTIASSVSRAIHLLTTRKFDLVLLDINLVDGSGFEIAEFINSNESLSSSKIIFMSADGRSETILKALQLRADDYITKPVRLEELILKVKNKVYYKELKSLSASRETASKTSGEDNRFFEPFTSLFQPPTPEGERIRQVLTLFRSDPHFRVDDAAEKLGVSKRSLHRMFRHTIGSSFTSTLSKCRLEHGYCLLETGHSVGYVARETGYRSASYFSTAFRKEFGITPKTVFVGRPKHHTL